MIKQYTDKEKTPLNFHNVLKILIIFNIVFSVIVTVGTIFSFGQGSEIPYIAFYFSYFLFNILIDVLMVLLYMGLRKFNKIILYLVAGLLLVSIVSTFFTLFLYSMYSVTSMDLIIEQIVFLIRNIVVQSLILLYYYKRLPLLDPDIRNTFRKKEKEATVVITNIETNES